MKLKMTALRDGVALWLLGGDPVAAARMLLAGTTHHVRRRPTRKPQIIFGIPVVESKAMPPGAVAMTDDAGHFGDPL
jgi:hypothetical protein